VVVGDLSRGGGEWKLKNRNGDEGGIRAGWGFYWLRMLVAADASGRSSLPVEIVTPRQAMKPA
jgi:hypothetical protein